MPAPKLRQAGANLASASQCSSFPQHYRFKGRRTPALICVGLIILMSYALTQDDWNANLRLPVHRMPPLETFITERSFSETQNAKATLQALATVFLTEFRTRYWSCSAQSGSLLASDHSIQPLSADGAILELQKALQEFEGTQQEMLILTELLRVLRKEERWEAWLDTYLRSLQRYPTGRFVQEWAAEASLISERLDRADQLNRAFALLRQWTSLEDKNSEPLIVSVVMPLK